MRLLAQLKAAIQHAWQSYRFAACRRKAAKIVESYRAQCPQGFEVYNAETLPTDVIVPALFTPYAIERTATLSAFWQAGVIDTDPQFAAIATGGGKTVSMPFWQDLSGRTQPLSATGALTTKKIVATQDAALIQEHGDAWSDNDLAGIYAGSDPADAVISLVADYWMRNMETHLLLSLKGVFGAASMSGATLDLRLTSGSTFTAANYLTGTTFIDAQGLMGDASRKLVAIAMHSAVERSLRKADMIDFIPDSEGKNTIATFQGLRVIVDDNMTIDVETGTTSPSNVYNTFLFGLGAIAYGVGRKDTPIRGGDPRSTWETEFDRVSLAGQNIFINRRRFILHPRGVKWTDAVRAGDNPTDVELATATNWTRVYEQKNVRMVRVQHNINLA